MTTDQPTTSRAPAADTRYQILLVGLLSLNFGILFFDRNALGFLMPFVKPDLGLTNAQVGMASSSLSFSWALAALFVGAAADRGARRKAALLAATIAFSLCSFLTGLATSFLVLLGTRLLMGVAEGGVAPISQSLTMLAVPPERRGIAMGVMQNFGSNLFGSALAPMLLIGFAAAWGWRHTFFLAGVPGLLSAFLIWRYVREPAGLTTREPVAAMPLRARVREVCRERNVVLCVLISVLLVAYLVICWSFAPLFLTTVRGFQPREMGWLMGTLGLSATLGSFVVSGISDRVGRRPVMIVGSFIGVLVPLGAMYYTGSAVVLAAIFFIGWGLNGLFPLFMATVPSESVGPRQMATAIALSMAMGEVLGGVLGPTLAGMAADRSGLAATMWIMVGLCIASGVLAFGLRETAPARLARAAAGG